VVEKKRIIAKYYVTAPKILIPADDYSPSCSMLVVDFGRLTFRKTSRTNLRQTTSTFSSPDKLTSHHDAWRLIISKIQVLSSTTMIIQQRWQTRSTQNIMDNNEVSNLNFNESGDSSVKQKQLFFKHEVAHGDTSSLQDGGGALQSV